MSLQISSSTIAKLGHEIPEIRLRALKHIDGKLQRSVDLNEDLIFSPGSLLKQFIRWFGQKPLQHEETVLRSILKLLQSKYASEAIRYLGKERLVKEFRKVEKIVSSSELKRLVSSIVVLIDNYQCPEKSSTSDKEELSDSSASNGTYSDILLDDTSEYETAWSVPSAPDYNSLKLLSESLANENQDSLQHSINFLEAAINDYPAEYFLQPPYIFNSLMLLNRNESIQSGTLLRVLTSLTKSLSGRIKKKQLSTTHRVSVEDNQFQNTNTQITTQRYCYVLFKLCIDCYKHSEEKSQPPQILLYDLLKEILDVIASDLHVYDFRNMFLADLGILAKYYRQGYTVAEPSNKLKRMLYIHMLQVITELLNIEGKKNVQLVLVSASAKTHYDPEVYMSTSARSSDSLENVDTWMAELECALFDFPLKEMYPNLYNRIRRFTKATDKCKFEAMLNCGDSFGPLVAITKRLSKISSKKLIIEGSKILETLLITKNVEFSSKLIEATVNCIPYYDGNNTLRDCAEKVLEKLISHEDVFIRRSVYKNCCDISKQYFAAIMDGEIAVNGKSSDHVPTFGIPLTTNILREIIIHGYVDEDAMIQSNAEMILVLILKAKPILEYRWLDILRILLPNLPLLQSVAAVRKSSLSALLLKLYDPDDKSSGLDALEQIRGNLRFLFSNDEDIRRDALSRLIYMLSIEADADEWIPNVLQISDTILNDICVSNTPRNVERMFTTGLYERNTVLALLELLKSPDVEPSIRKTTLLQLNVMCQDPELLDFIHCETGWSLALRATHNALQKNGSVDFPDAALPAVGIISKIALCHPDFRRELADEKAIYFLILRALFSYPYEDAFKQDCILLLFLLTYSAIIIGSKIISVPEMCNGLKLPITCRFVSQEVQNAKRSPIEQAYSELFANIPSSSRSFHSTDFIFDMSHANDSALAIKESVLQFLRLQLAISWCNGFANVLEEFSRSKNVINPSSQSSKRSSEERSDNLSVLRECLKYNPELILRETDIQFVSISSQDENIKQFLYDASNATNHDQILISVAKIRLCLLIWSKVSTYHQRNILNTFKRYIMTPPNNDNDLILFENISHLLMRLIVSGNDETLFLILTELRSKHCLFLYVLKNRNFSLSLYKATCKFLQIIIKHCIYHKDQDEIRSYLISNQKNERTNFYNELLENVYAISEDCFRERDIDRFRALLSLIQFVSASGSVDLDEGFSMCVAKRMINYTIKLKSFTQTGSHLTKNALLITRNILGDIKEVILEDKYLKCLSGLCAHQDFEIRALSWCILDKISTSLNGAHTLVKALSFLPGGFHACCLSTFLDMNEIPIVRSTAGELLSNLLTYTKDAPHGKNLNLSVAPLCSNMATATTADSLELIIQLLDKHRFFNRITDSLEFFYISDIILISEDNKSIITCDIVRAYCSIIVNFAELNPELLLHYFEYPCFEKIFQIINDIPSCITESSLSMLAEICNLLMKFLQTDESLVQSIVSRDQKCIRTLVDFLDWSLYENSSILPPIRILQVLKIAAKDTSVYSTVVHSISADNCAKFLKFLCYAINCKDTPLQRSCLEFINTLLIKGQFNTHEFQEFHNVLDNMVVSEDLNVKICHKKSEDNATKPTCASEVLLILLYNLLSASGTDDKGKHSCEKQNLYSCCTETLGTLLKCSKPARNMACHIKLLNCLLGKLQKVFDGMGMTCTDFIRKYGDAKKQPIIDEFMCVFEIILNWFYADILVDEKEILNFTKILLNTWPWINHSGELRITFIRLLAFVSENSLAVCRQFSSPIPGHTTTILQQLITHLVQETAKGKNAQIDIGLLQIGLRAITNCCSCIEGRLQSIKFNVLDVFDKFHPSITKSHKNWNPIILLWLKYWEIFSRYPEGATVRNLHLLGILFTKSTPEIRYQCLSVLRNMSFLSSNRAALYSSEDFLYISKTTLSNGSRSEQLLILVAIWRLVADNYKAKHVIKSTSIPKQIRTIYGELETACNEDNNENNFVIILEILDKIFE